MNILQQFQAVLGREHRAVAKITGLTPTGYMAETTSGHQPVALVGTGYKVGQVVFYDMVTRRILESAPDLEVVDLVV